MPKGRPETFCQRALDSIHLPCLRQKSSKTVTWKAHAGHLVFDVTQTVRIVRDFVPPRFRAWCPRSAWILSVLRDVSAVLRMGSCHQGAHGLQTSVLLMRVFTVCFSHLARPVAFTTLFLSLFTVASQRSSAVAFTTFVLFHSVSHSLFFPLFFPARWRDSNCSAGGPRHVHSKNVREDLARESPNRSTRQWFCLPPMSCMSAVVRVDFVRALDGKAPWRRRLYKSACGLAPRWEVVLTNEDGTMGTVTAEYRNRGAKRDAYVLDEKRIMKIAPIGAHGCHNELETENYRIIVLLGDTNALPKLLGSGRSIVSQYEYSWLILERATWTMSDVMLHLKGYASPTSERKSSGFSQCRHHVHVAFAGCPREMRVLVFFFESFCGGLQ